MEVHILLLDIEAASVWNKLDEESTFYKLYFTLLLLFINLKSGIDVLSINIIDQFGSKIYSCFKTDR